MKEQLPTPKEQPPILVLKEAQRSHWTPFSANGLQLALVCCLLILLSISTTSAQSWTVYNENNSGMPRDDVWAVTVDDSGNKWVGTYGGGLAKFDGSNWTVYNTSNSGIPDDDVSAIAIDGNGNKWIGTYGGGLAKFDGSNWTVYDTSNSGLLGVFVMPVTIDGSGNKWIGTNGGGLAEFDGTNWTVYDTSNSGIPHFDVNAVRIDGNGNKWIGTNKGLAKFDGANWTVYDTSNSKIPGNGVNAVSIDGSGNKWIGTNKGFAKFDGTNWTVYDTSNSGNNVRAIAIDGNGDKWIGTYGDGLAVYGQTTDIEERQGANPPVSHQSHPNPFRTRTTIEFRLPRESKVELAVYDPTGKRVATLAKGRLDKGQYTRTFRGEDRSAGIYFYELRAGGERITGKLVLTE